MRVLRLLAAIGRPNRSRCPATRDPTILTSADQDRLKRNVAEILAKGDELCLRLARWLERAAAAAVADIHQGPSSEPAVRASGHLNSDHFELEGDVDASLQRVAYR